jgi:hypothetical protein
MPSRKRALLKTPTAKQPIIFTPFTDVGIGAILSLLETSSVSSLTMQYNGKDFEGQLSPSHGKTIPLPSVSQVSALIKSAVLLKDAHLLSSFTLSVSPLEFRFKMTQIKPSI